MQKYKVDWLAFSVSFEDEGTDVDPQLFENIKLVFEDFDETYGRFF